MNPIHKGVALDLLSTYINDDSYKITSYIIPFNIALCSFRILSQFIPSPTAIEKMLSLIFEHLNVSVYDLEDLEPRIYVLLSQEGCTLIPGLLDVWSEENYMFREILYKLFKEEIFSNYVNLEDIFYSEPNDVDLGNFLMFESIEYDGPESLVLKFHYLEKQYELH